MKVLQILFIVLVLALSLAPVAPVVLADHCEAGYEHAPAAPAGQSPPCAPTTAQGLLDIISKVFTTMFIFLVTIASFTLLYAAFLYVTSEGEQEKINQAKKIIIYAVVALIVAALAFGAPRAVQTFITG